MPFSFAVNAAEMLSMLISSAFDISEVGAIGEIQAVLRYGVIGNFL